MSDPQPHNPAPIPPATPDPDAGGADQKKPLRNPPRRQRRERAAARKEAEKAHKAAEESAEAERRRGVVCAACGKYHDVTGRPAGQTFTCSKVCDAEIVVPAPPPPPAVPPPPLPARVRETELRRTRRLAMISAIVGFSLAILLCSAAIWVWWTEGKLTTAICAGVMGLGFLVSAAIAASEMRHASAELAGAQASEA